MSVQLLCDGPGALLPGALRGYRTWRINEEGYLLSTAMPTVWPEERWAAECLAPSPVSWSSDGRVMAAPRPRHLSPDADCKCGIYGWYDPADTRMVATSVFGAIEVSGRIRLGDHGFRAEFARVLAVSFNHTHPLAPMLRARMLAAGVAVHSDRSTLVDAYPPDDVSSLVDHDCDGLCATSAIASQSSGGWHHVSFGAVTAGFAKSMHAAAAAAEALWRAANPALGTDDPVDPRQKALEARRNRGTGPKPKRRWLS